MTAKQSKKLSKSSEQKIATSKFKVKPQKSILKNPSTPAAVEQQKQVTQTGKKKNSKRVSIDVAPNADEETTPVSPDGETTPVSPDDGIATSGEQPPTNARQPKKRKPRSQHKIGKRVERQQRNNSAALSLRTWHSNRSEWKYTRKLQAHLIQKCLSKHCLNKEDFSIFLDYATTINGGSLVWLTSVCEQKLKEVAEKTANSSENDESVEDKTQRTARVRASKILKRIQGKTADAAK